MEKYADRVPVREHEWDNRHFWRVSNAEHLAMSENAGMFNLSHFAVYDVSGIDAESLMEYVCVARVGGSTAIGKGIYTHFLDQRGGVRADLTVIRMAEDRFRVIDGADAGHRGLRLPEADRGRPRLERAYRGSQRPHCLSWSVGPQCAQDVAGHRGRSRGTGKENFPFATTRSITLRGIPVQAFRISYVGEQGWELHVPFSYGLSLWDLVFEQGAVPVGVETYANSRRLEKSLRLQNADLLTEYNLVEADLARPKVKDADFHGKAAYLEQRAREHQPAYLCTMVMTENTDSNGVAPLSGRYLSDYRSRVQSGARGRSRAPVLYDEHRLWPVHRQEHHARLPAERVCEDRPGTGHRVFQRAVSRARGGGGLQGPV